MQDYFWVLFSELVRPEPMGRRAATVQQPRGGQEKGACTHGNNSRSVGRTSFDPGDERKMRFNAAVKGICEIIISYCRNENKVGAACVFDRGRWVKGDPVRKPDWFLCQRHQLNVERCCT